MEWNKDDDSNSNNDADNYEEDGNPQTEIFQKRSKKK